MAVYQLSDSIIMLQERLNHFEQALGRVEQTLIRIQRRLQTLPMPDPVSFPKEYVSGEKAIGKYYCSFCGKSQDEVIKLIAGPTVFICDECTTLCMEIVRE